MPTRPPPFSWVILLTLLALLAASTTVFVVLVRRWTTRRSWVALGDWARQRRFRFQRGDAPALPAPLAELVAGGDPARRLLGLTDEHVTVMQVQTADGQRWNLLSRRIPSRQPRGAAAAAAAVATSAAIAAAAALRAAHVQASFLDKLKLAPFPSLALGHRFNVLGSASTAARTLADSASRTLLPADISLLVAGEWILLDFSTRPFDPIELDRMLALAQQLGQML